MASNDPDFEQKAADIIGLYLNPPAHAAVFCVDEKTHIQALDRKDPVLPLSPGRLERVGCVEPQQRQAHQLIELGKTRAGCLDGRLIRGQWPVTTIYRL